MKTFTVHIETPQGPYNERKVEVDGRNEQDAFTFASTYLIKRNEGEFIRGVVEA